MRPVLEIRAPRRALAERVIATPKGEGREQRLRDSGSAGTPRLSNERVDEVAVRCDKPRDRKAAGSARWVVLDTRLEFAGVQSHPQAMTDEPRGHRVALAHHADEA